MTPLTTIRNLHQNQTGVSLLMAILVLASITAISFSLATIVLTEIRSSSDIVRSERALYASYAITEEALFKYSRHPSFSYNFGNTSLNSVTLSISELQVNPVPFMDVITPGTTEQYNLIDQADPYGPGGFGSVRVVYSGTAEEPLYINLDEIDPVTGARTVKSSTGTDPLTENGEEWEDTTLDTDMQYDLQITHQGSTEAVTVTIYTHDGSGADKGIPSYGETFVDILATYLGLTRKYETRIPVLD